MADEGEKLYRAEYAKSNRAACKKCSRLINKDELRLAVMVRSNFHDGKDAHWHHFECFFGRARPKVHTDIAGIDRLRWDDQERLKERIAQPAAAPVDACKPGKKGKKGAAVANEYSDFQLEYAKSSRSGCRGCEEKIQSGSIRIGKMDYDGELSLKFGPHPNWYHSQCFVAKREDLGFGETMDIKNVRGFTDLDDDDRKSLAASLPFTKPDRKRKADDSESGASNAKKSKVSSKELDDEKKKLKEQADLLWSIRDQLERDVDKSALRGLLEYNEQDLPAGEARILDTLADCMAFGALERCPNCKNGQVYFSSTGVYKCFGHTEWSKCMYMTSKPTRRPFKVPKEYHDVPYLKKYKYVKRDRYITQDVINSATQTLVSSADLPSTSQRIGGEANNNANGGSNSSANVFNSRKPLTHLNFALSGKLDRTQADLKAAITALGGRIDSAADYHVLITVPEGESTAKSGRKSKGGAKSGEDKLAEARSKNAFICSTALITEIESLVKSKMSETTGENLKSSKSLQKEGAEADTKLKVEPGTEDSSNASAAAVMTLDSLLDVFERHRVVAECGTRSTLNDAILGSYRSVVLKSGAKSGSTGAKSGKSMYTKSVPDKLKLMVKDGAAVDPESELDSVAHVFKQNGRFYTAVLNQVDLVRDKNSYYKLQLLESDSKNRWWVFRSWGRIGTTIGGTKVEKFHSRDNAIASFEERYEIQTGNKFGSSNFVKKPGLYFPLDIDYGSGGSDNVPQLLDAKSSRSKLPLPVRELICSIFDVEAMRRTMMEFELDLRKMPLGKLSRSQITSAFSVLTQLGTLCEERASVEQFLDATTRFYTMIPHDFGVNRPPLIDTVEAVKEKIDMLDSLLDIETAYSLLRSDEKVSGGQEGGEPDPVDTHYAKLHCDIRPVERDTDVFKLVEAYVRNTHAATHSAYELAIDELFEVARDGEADRFESFNELRRMLLWHGSRMTNYAGILSQGLRIAPPEAPVTGYMFGKGLYFADMVSKSANYCYPSKEKNSGLLLLCEVAVGEPWELTSAKNVTKLPKGKHSVKGIGATAPDPENLTRTSDGIEVPVGSGKPNKELDNHGGRSDLLYNEYIVYDTAQVRIRYMLKLRFNFKY